MAIKNLGVTGTGSLLYDMYQLRKPHSRGSGGERQAGDQNEQGDTAEFGGKRRYRSDMDSSRPWPLGALKDSNNKVALAARQLKEICSEQTCEFSRQDGETPPDTQPRGVPRGYIRPPGKGQADIKA